MTAAQHEPREERIPIGPALSEAIGRLLFRSEQPASDYGRCVQIAQLLGDAATHSDTVGDFARGELIRSYAFAVSQGGGALCDRGAEPTEVLDDPLADPSSERRRRHGLCGSRSAGGFACTRRADHQGRHSASTGQRVVASWGDGA